MAYLFGHNTFSSQQGLKKDIIISYKIQTFCLFPSLMLTFLAARHYITGTFIWYYYIKTVLPFY